MRSLLLVDPDTTKAIINQRLMKDLAAYRTEPKFETQTRTSDNWRIVSMRLFQDNEGAHRDNSPDRYRSCYNDTQTKTIDEQ